MRIITVNQAFRRHSLYEMVELIGQAPGLPAVAAKQP